MPLCSWVKIRLAVKFHNGKKAKRSLPAMSAGFFYWVNASVELFRDFDPGYTEQDIYFLILAVCESTG